LLEVAEIQKNLQLSNMKLSKEHIELQTQEIVEMYYLDGTVKKVALNEATRQVIQRALDISKMDL
jgi:hypothetical protein